jgi:protein-S-isoprenylcysteine O-methyltransferase Ste14
MPDREVTWKQLILRFLVSYAIIGGLMFTVAWDAAWWQAWVYIGITGLPSFFSRVVAMRRNPELLSERLHSMEKEDVRGWDKVLMPLVAIVFPILMILTAALDVRFAWSPTYHLAWTIGAVCVIAAGAMLAASAFTHNAFFSGTVRIQHDRGHTVVSTGPYRCVRHPGYAGGFMANLATPVLLGSLWALIPAAILCAFLVVRTALEDRTLRSDLPGYAEYTERTRYRLLPLVW